MTYSLGEVESLAKRAARGAGYGWGMVDEVGKATRWLCAHEFDGCNILVKVLAHADALTSKNGPLCPFGAGVSVVDRAALFVDQPIKLHDVVMPIALMPFAAGLATRFGSLVTVSWCDFEGVTNGRTLSILGDPYAMRVSDVTILRNGTNKTARRLCSRANPTPADWTTLNALAARTYAPATEESRDKGAGAGTTDND